MEITNQSKTIVPCCGVNVSMRKYKNERQHLKIWHPNSQCDRSDLVQQRKKTQINLCPMQTFHLKIKLQLPWFKSFRSSAVPSPSSLSSADLAQPVVRLGVGYDGLDGYDGLVDLGLELPQLLDVQQAQDLGRLVQSGI